MFDAQQCDKLSYWVYDPEDPTGRLSNAAALVWHGLPTVIRRRVPRERYKMFSQSPNPVSLGNTSPAVTGASSKS